MIVTSACARVKINDAEVCGDMGPLGASCFHTLTDEARDIEKEQWDEERFGLLCTTSASYANWKAAIEKLCKQTRACTYEDKKVLKKLGKKLKDHDKQTAVLRGLLL